MPGILAGNLVDRAKGFQGPQGNVREVADGGRDKGYKRVGTLLGHGKPIDQAHDLKKARKPKVSLWQALPLHQLETGAAFLMLPVLLSP